MNGDGVSRVTGNRRLNLAVSIVLVGTTGAIGVSTVQAAPRLASSLVFLHKGGRVVKRQLHERANITTFEVLKGLAQVTCQSGTAGGEIVGGVNQYLVTGIQITFKRCLAKNNANGRTCPVHSPGPSGGRAKNQIVTNKLRGELVGVAREEAVTGTGLLISPASAGGPFLTFETQQDDNCLPVPKERDHKVPVFGGVIAEVTVVNREVGADPLVLEIAVGPYGETSQVIQHPLGAGQRVLTAFGGIESPIRSSISMAFQERVEVRS